MGRYIIVLPGAGPPFRQEEGDAVICADSGYLAAKRLGLKVHLLVGDMDSISERDLDEAKAEGVDVRPYPVDKDRTDGELALDLALSSGPGSVVILGGKVGRTDHVVGAFTLLFKVPKDVPAELWMGPTRTVLLRGPQRMSFPSDLPVVSLVPLTAVMGVRTWNLRWQLDGEDLEVGSTRGVHNEPLSDNFSISIDEGSLLLIRCPLDG